MSNPTQPPVRKSDDEDHLPVLEEALRSGTHSLSEEVIPLVEETAAIGKRQVVSGRVRVQTVTDMVEELAHADVERETVEVTRVPVDKVVVLVVEKRLVLKEELHIRRRVAAETVEVPVTLRKQRAIVERIAPDASNPDEETPP
jgi:stress response protein YsnF